MVGGVEIGSQSKWDPDPEGFGTCAKVQMGSRGRGSHLVQRDCESVYRDRVILFSSLKNFLRNVSL